jgi:hypothetical protein
MSYADDIPAKYLTEIGAISVNTARLDQVLAYCIALLNCCDLRQADIDTTLCLVGGEGFSELLSKLEKLFYLKVKDTTLRGEFDQIKGRLVKVNQARNKCVHSYLTAPKPGLVERSKMVRDMNKEEKLGETGSFSLHELRFAANESFAVGQDLISLLNENLDVIHTKYKPTFPGLAMGRIGPKKRK